MEWSGDEKRIQALFSELRIADELNAPRFDALVNRAETAIVRPRRGFNPSFAWAVVLVCAIAMLAWWGIARFRQTTSAPLVTTSTSTAKIESLSVAGKPSEETYPAQPGTDKKVGSKLSDINRSQLLATRLAVRRRAVMLAANKKVLEDAKAIAKWASPTAALLSSSTDQVLTSLPQLNQNANQLKSFLPSSSN